MEEMLDPLDFHLVLWKTFGQKSKDELLGFNKRWAFLGIKMQNIDYFCLKKINSSSSNVFAFVRNVNSERNPFKKISKKDKFTEGS